MSTQYWIGGFFIDLSRNQITQNNQTQTLAPKALAVLTYLAENRGQVVSQDALLTKVWQGTAVSPNTLQKSIAQLRKALGNEGSVYIKTHAKQGYSLECDVRWQDSGIVTEANSDIASGLSGSLEVGSEIKSESSPEIKPQGRSKYPLGIIALIVAILVLGVIGLNTFQQHQQPPTLTFGQMRAVTSSDNKEIASVYSPDGRYVVFHRYSDENCINNIWAKDLQSKKEIQLTKNSDAYGRHSFSKDGKQLVFIRTVDCEEPINQKQCYQLVSLDFQKALEAPQDMRILLECKNTEISRPKWLKNNHIALMQKTSDRWRLISYSIDENKSEVIHSISNGNIVDFDYSLKKDLIALTSIHGDGKYYIEVLKPDGKIVSSNPIRFPKEIPGTRNIYPNFSSIENQLIFSTGRQLFTLSTDGQVNSISLPLEAPMGSPVSHPNGNQMLAIKGFYDSDIIALPLPKLAKNSEAEVRQLEKTNYTLLHRSTASDHTAKFQPNGKLLAFVSARSGEDQIWIADEQNTYQLTDFPMDNFIDGMEWSADGKSLMVNAYRELKQVFLDGTERNINFERPIQKLLDWNSNQQSALVNVLVNGVFKLAEINLTNYEVKIINEKRVKWALKTEEGRIVYTDHMDRFWWTGPIEDQLIAQLTDQGSERNFLIKGDNLYGVNEDFQLWSFTMKDQQFEVLGNVPKKIDYLTDINDTQVFATLRVKSRKEVVELFLRN